MTRPTIIFMAPSPPPYMGPSTATEVLLGSGFASELDVIHIDTADRRPLTTLGRFDLTNLGLALKHYFLLLGKLLTTRVELVYVPISQTTVGYLRDVPFILLARLFGKKLVLHLRGGYFREFYDSSGRLMKFIVRTTLRRADRMIVLGEGLKKLFDGLIPEEKLSVVPNGLDLEIPERSDYRGGGVIRVLFLGNLVRSKGFFEVLEAAAKVREKHGGVEFVFAGAWQSDADRRECEDYVRVHGLDGCVRFAGPVHGPAKLELLRDSDVLAFPTYYPPEGHPWVVVEAMAAGLPIISTDQGAITDSVRDGENGFIVEKRDPARVAEKIGLLISDPGLRERMGKSSRELYLRNFTGDHFCRRMTSVIMKTLKQ